MLKPFSNMIHRRGGGYYNEITILKVIATLFITWFHFKWNVPEQYAPLFIGGAIGNSLFFFCSGYLLKIKSERYPGEWLIQKLIRILPSVWVYMGITLLLGVATYNWNNIIYPTPYWFVNAILCFFVIFYLFRKQIDKFPCVSYCIVGILHISWYVINGPYDKIVMDEGGLKCWFFFFIFFLYGYAVHKNTKKAVALKYAILGTICSIGAFYLYKTLCNRFDLLIHLQVIIIPLILWLIIFFFYALAMHIAKIDINDKIKRILSHLSNLTLDIYIVQIILINYFMPKISFPINIIITFMIIIATAYVNNTIAGKISDMIKDSLKPKTNTL